MSETDTVGQHISKIETMAQSLADVGEPVGEIDKIAKTLGSLPFKYGSFITAWDSYDENKQTFDNLTARLLKEEQRLAQGDETTSALAVIKEFSYDENKQTFDNLTARLLKEEQRLAQGDETTSALAAIKVSQSKSKLRSSGNETKRSFSKKNLECYYCHKKGHFKSECRNLQSKRNAEKSQNNSQAFSAEIKNILTEGYENVWLADSAASKHMTFHKEFENFEKRSTSRYALLEWPILQNNEEAEGAQPAERNEVTAETEDAKIEQIENRQLRNRENIQPPARYRDDIVACAAVVEEPQTYEEAKSSNEMQQWQEAMEEAKSSNEMQQWQEAMEEEIRSLNKNNTQQWQEAMEEEIRSLNKNNTWALVPLPENRIGIDYNETFSPVIRYDSIRILLAIAATRNLEINKKNNTWTLVPLPENRKVIGCKWVYRIKHKCDGTIERY
ncbi:hypothetical protein QE152_g25640 [Popillia japonica]|uniref:CCHC-type domain-containing protein n=1 Tax=Popillia japonica TaxID=7064 RepID=A0AAW1JZH8_POPJA